MPEQHRVRSLAATASVHAALALALVVVLYPVLWIVKIALTGDPGFALLGAPLSFVALERLADAGFGRSLLLSGGLALSATVIGLGFATTTAYAMSRFDFMGRAQGTRLLLLTQMFPALLMSVPLFLGLKATGLLGSLGGLVIVYATTSVPFCAWMLKGHFDALPRSLDEAALLDGASAWQRFYYIALPLSRPGLAVTGLYAFMGAWNEYILAATFLNDATRYPAPVVLKSLVGAFSADWGAFAAGSLLVSLPVMVVFFLMQRNLVAGLVQGAVKE